MHLNQSLSEDNESALVARSIISLAAVAQGGSHMGMREGAALQYLACQHISEYQQ